MSRIEQAWLSRGPLAIALLPLSGLYGLVAGLRRAMFRGGLARVDRLDVPVVVVGNLIAGGAGKTPTVIAVAELLRAAGWRPGIISRGYGREGDGLVKVQPDTPASACGDEPLLIRLRSGLPVMVGRDRVAAGRALRRLHPSVDLILADDGLQHLRLARDVEVVVFDERGAGNGWLLPSGPLREPLRPRCGPSLVLYNAERASTPWPGFLATRRLAGAVAIDDWRAGAPPRTTTLEGLRDRPLLAVAGTARPGRFFDMLHAAGLTITERPCPDHDRFDTLPWPPGTPDVILTEKDAVKLVGRVPQGTRVWVAPLDFRPEPGFGEALLRTLTGLGFQFKDKD